MKILQTLGKHAGAQEGVFQYKRTPAGVVIDSSIKKKPMKPVSVTLTDGEWNLILTEIQKEDKKLFRLSDKGAPKSGPSQSLYSVIGKAVPKPSGGWKWSDSWKAAVCGILEHEGSIDFYHGIMGPDESIVLCVSRDF